MKGIKGKKVNKNAALGELLVEDSSPTQEKIITSNFTSLLMIKARKLDFL